MADKWWVVVPPSEQGWSTIPPDAKIISTPIGSQAYNTLLNTDHGQVNGYTRFMGPFDTQQQAQSAAPGKATAGEWATIVIGAAVTGAGNNPTNVQNNLNTGSTVVAAADSVTGVIKDIWNYLQSPGLWLRIAEGVLGTALILVAVAELGKGTAVAKAIKKVPFV